MFPTLATIGKLNISSYGVCMLLAFISLAFIIWRRLRNKGIADELIFDNVIVIVIIGFIGARVQFVVTHWSLFSKSFLWIPMIWRYPGFSFWGGFISALISLYVYTKMQKLSLSLVADSYAKAFPLALFFAALGVFLDGTIVGKPTALPWGLPVAAEVEKRHPVGLYAMVISIVVMIITQVLLRKVAKKEPPATVLFWVTISVVGFLFLLLAFVRVDILYLDGFSVDHIIATILLVMPWVPLYGLLNGRAFLGKLLHKVRRSKKLELPI